MFNDDQFERTADLVAGVQQLNVESDETDEAENSLEELKYRKKACIKGSFVLRPLEKRKSVAKFRFSFFKFLKRARKTKLACAFKWRTIFRALNKRKTDFEFDFLFSLLGFLRCPSSYVCLMRPPV